MHIAQRVAVLLVLFAVACNGDDTTGPPVTTGLTCQDPMSPGGLVGCSLTLDEPAGFRVKITHISTCEAEGNLFRITAPVVDTLTTNGCFDQVGKEIVHMGPFPAGTEITAEAQSPPLLQPPSLRVEGEYPEWILHFEDGVDDDFDDLTFTLTALPAS